MGAPRMTAGGAQPRAPLTGLPIHRTLYKTAYRRSSAPARPRYACCPGWQRTSRLPGACTAGEAALQGP